MQTKLLVILISLCATLNLYAKKSVYDYTGHSMADALVDFNKRNPELKISFIYNELELYKVKGKIKSTNPLQAIKELVALNPISVTTDKDEIYIEAMQKGHYKYTGRVMSEDSGEPVGYATVMLLNPKDSTTITYAITDEKGFFSIPCDRKKVLAKFSSVGYRTLYLSAPSFSMGNIRMEVLPIKLREVVSSPEAQYALADRIVYLPSTREKNAATNGTDLLRFMAIPSILVNKNSVSTLSGQNVTLFIDSARASEEEIKALRPQDVKKVEVLDYPSDPKFEGVRYAVNFIMVKYEYGGYVKVSGNQRLDFDYGDYNLSSKFAHGKMTYDLFTGYNYYQSDKISTNSLTSYKFADREIERSQTTPETNVKSNEAYLSLRAKYVSDNSMISNQLSIKRDDSPRNSYLLNNIYSPAIYPEEEARTIYSNSSLTPSWRGNYQFTLPHSIQLVVTPSLVYSHNKSLNFFSEDNIENINDVDEKAWRGSAGIGMSKQWNSHSLTVNINGELEGKDLLYTGNNPADILYRFEAIGIRVAGTLTFNKLRLQPSVKFYYSKTKFNDLKFSQPLPGYYISGDINFNRKNKLNFSSEMSQWTIGASYRSPNIVVRDLLDAVKGNPDLKTWLYNSVDFDYTWLPCQWLNLSAYSSYNRHTKPMEYTYAPTHINGREMMLQSYIKEGYFQTIAGGVGIVARLFKRSLTLRAQSSLYNHRHGGKRKYTATSVLGNFSASYYLGDFYFYLSYQLKSKKATQIYQLSESPASSYFNIGWSKNGLNISASIDNIFKSSRLSGKTYMQYENYSKRQINFSDDYRRMAWLSLTYTFNYGKKVKTDGIDKGSSISSGILK